MKKIVILVLIVKRKYKIFNFKIIHFWYKNVSFKKPIFKLYIYKYKKKSQFICIQNLIKNPKKKIETIKKNKNKKPN